MPRLYASEFTTGGVHVIDIGTAAEVHVVATSALQVALSPDGQWLALAQGGPTVRFVQASTNTLGPAITTSLAGSYGLAWAPDSSKVYVSGNGDGIQSVQPDGTLGPMFVSTAVTTGKLALSPDGTTLYVCAGTDIYGVDASSGAFVHHFPGLAGTYGLAVSPDNAVLYATDGVSPGGNVYRITIATGTITGAGGGLDGPTDIAMSADGAHLWVAVNVAGQVKVLDAATLALPGVHTITVDHPYQLALTPDGTQMWVGRSADPAYPLDQVIYAYDTTTYAQTAGPTFSAFVQINSMSAGVSASGIGGGGGGGGSPAAATLRLGPMAVTVTGTVGAPTIAGHATLNLGPVVVVAADHVTTRTGTMTLALGPVRVVAVAGRVGPGAFPVPGFRGRWRLTLHQRAFAPATLNSTIIAELADAYGRQLVQAWDTPALLTFTLDGRSQSAALVAELLHDVVAWRWDDQTGLEQAVFRGPITQSEDQLTTEGHTVTYTCHDYTAMLTRRILTSTYSVTGRDQDLIVGDLLGLASTPSTSSGTALSPAGFLPVGLLAVNGDGSLRGLSAQLRDRTYYGSQDVGQAVDDLAHVDGGFDYDIVPSAVDDHDSLRVFYPAQGVTRTDIALQYGSTVASLTRSVDSADYANYVRVLGNNQSANPILSFDEFAQKFVDNLNGLIDNPKAGPFVLGAVQNRKTSDRVIESENLPGKVWLKSRAFENPMFRKARLATPVVVELDSSKKDIFSKELFGPIALLIKTKNTDESIALARDLAQQHGAISCAAYTTDAAVREKIADEMSLAATPVSFNLTGAIYMNQNAAFSDFHVTGGNPSGNASFTNPEYVSKRFTWVGHREPVKA